MMLSRGRLTLQEISSAINLAKWIPSYVLLKLLYLQRQVISSSQFVKLVSLVQEEKNQETLEQSYWWQHLNEKYRTSLKVLPFD